MRFTDIIVVVTAIVSYQGFSKPELVYKYIFNAYRVYHNKEWYRVITHGFLHADWMHLIFNMLALYSFGGVVEEGFKAIFSPQKGIIYFLLLYFSSMVFSSLYSLAKHKDNAHYNAVGASGAVSAVVYASILLVPNGEILIYFIPMPSILFGVLYLALSFYLAKKGQDNVGHDAHFWGAVFGFVFPIVMKPELLGRFIQIVQEML